MNNETQKGWRERLREEVMFRKDDLGFPRSFAPQEVEDFIDELLAAQETAFKEKAREARREGREDVLIKLNRLLNKYSKGIFDGGVDYKGFYDAAQDVEGELFSYTRIERFGNSQQ